MPNSTDKPALQYRATLFIWLQKYDNYLKKPKKTQQYISHLGPKSEVSRRL